jgi:NAD(P)-dependent dehydrogenase (short-subunit alcohol dehydrogenase family)
MELKDKIVVVTGASRGLGAAIAEILAASGAKVVMCARSKSDLDAVTKIISSSGGVCESQVVDVTKSSEVEKFIAATVKKHKAIDVLVNNAGAVTPIKNAELVSYDEYRTCMQANVDSVFYFIKNVLPVMRQQNSGLVVNVSSGAGKRAHPGISVYSASKFAVEGLTQAVARELEQTGIKCFALVPAGINTGMRAALFGKGDAERQQSPVAVAGILKDIILGKIAVPNGADVFIEGGTVTGVADNLNL